MNQRKAKALRKKSYQFAVLWLKSMLNEEEAEKVTVESLKRFESSQEQYIWDDGTLMLAPYSSRWFYQKLKKKSVDFTIQSIRELGTYGS